MIQIPRTRHLTKITMNASAPIGKFKPSSNAFLRGERALSGRKVVQRWKVRPIGVLNFQQNWLPPAFINLLCLDLLHRDLVMHCTPQFHETLDFASRPRWTSREKRKGEQSWRDTAARTLIFNVLASLGLPLAVLHMLCGAQ